MAGKFDFVKGANGFSGAAEWWQGGRLAREGAEFEEEFLPTTDNDLAAFDLTECHDAAELGSESLVVGEEKHALAVALAGVTKREFKGVPGFSGPGAAVDEQLAVFRELVEQRKAGGELPFEELLGVIDEGTFFLWQGPLAKGFQHGTLLKGIDGIADVVGEDPKPSGNPVLQIIAGDEPVPRDALEVFDIRRRIHIRNAQNLFDERWISLLPDATDHSLPLGGKLGERIIATRAFPAAGLREMPRQR